jgi:hypothetical protein
MRFASSLAKAQLRYWNPPLRILIPRLFDLVEARLEQVEVHADRLIVTARPAEAMRNSDQFDNGIEITVPWSPKVLRPQRNIHTAKELSEAAH